MVKGKGCDKKFLTRHPSRQFGKNAAQERLVDASWSPLGIEPDTERLLQRRWGVFFVETPNDLD